MLEKRPCWRISGPYFLAIGLNTGKYGTEKLPMPTLFLQLMTTYLVSFELQTQF